MQSLYEILKTSKLGAGSAPDMYTALMSQKMGGGGSVIEYTGAVPVTIRANGEPLLAWTISGNMQQTGTPTPENPITPQETGERTGNLAPVNWAQDFVTRINDTNNANIITDDNRTALRLGAGAGYGDYDNKYIFKINFKTNTQYTFSFYGKRLSNQAKLAIMRLQYTDDTYSDFVPENDGNYNYYTITSNANKNVKYLRAAYTSGSFNIDINTFMVNEGSTALPYEPYGIKIPISSGGVTTPVYLGEVESTRQIRKLVLTGEENFQKHGSISGLFTLTSITDYLFVNATTTLSTHYNSVSNYGSSYVLNGCLAFFWGSGRTERILYIHDDAYTSAADFKTYLQQQYAAGTPVTVWYVLAESETGIVNEPIRKIGDYADTISNVAEIPTTSGSQTFDVDTSLKPSEVYIKYRGG